MEYKSKFSNINTTAQLAVYNMDIDGLESKEVNQPSISFLKRTGQIRKFCHVEEDEEEEKIIVKKSKAIDEDILKLMQEQIEEEDTL